VQSARDETDGRTASSRDERTFLIVSGVNDTDAHAAPLTYLSVPSYSLRVVTD